MRAALYARVSTEEQTEGYSIDAQVRAFNTLVEAKGWTVFKEYIEEGKSARTEDINKRPIFKEIVADALSNKFDVLVVHKLDRFSRNLRITLEYFDKLNSAGCSFLSISEQMDFTTPIGKVLLALLGAFAQYYSDNLSQETKKGWNERRAQGYYCGQLPFGAVKGEDGVPLPNPDTYSGLVMAFELAAQGKSAREVAIALNAAGYKTSGNQGKHPFCKDTVYYMLQNRFYIGYLKDGNGGWVKARHKPFIGNEIWEGAQEARERNRTAPKNHPSNTSVSSLTGIAYCWHCKGRIHTGTSADGKKRMFCANKVKGWACSQKSTLLEVYDRQIGRYLESFHIPGDYQEKILEAHKKLLGAYDDSTKKRAHLEARLERIKKLFAWGDITEKKYMAEKEEILVNLNRLSIPKIDGTILERLATFLNSVAAAWKGASHEQRNAIARQLFTETWIKDKQVVAVKPRPELELFFKLSYEEFLKKFETAKPMGVSPYEKLKTLSL
ncbi:MAG: recombinase family protein [Dehalococcoidia bacterium]|jgi:DNA invertase Pin-like site-specific DNA recombinase